MSKQQLVFIIYDGLENSVFEGQVLDPIVQHYAHTNKVLLVSFERNFNNKNLIEKIESSHPDVSLKIFKRFPYFGKISLINCIYNLHKILNSFSNYKIIARGPIAGLIALKSANFENCEKITVQARGLLPDEYIHSNTPKNIIEKKWHSFRKNILYNLEKSVYKIHENINYEIEAVSAALKEHLENNYSCKSNIIKIAENDVPDIFPAKIIQEWKEETRELLKIPKDFTVYCYSGSAKSWQCPEDVVNFFQNKIKNDKNSYLLIFTQQPKTFQAMLEKSNINKQNYLIKTVDYSEIYKYLSAADYGIIFREINVLNWISRPTKALEYEAVGLKIIHNNTVKWLVDKY